MNTNQPWPTSKLANIANVTVKHSNIMPMCSNVSGSDVSQIAEAMDNQSAEHPNAGCSDIIINKSTSSSKLIDINAATELQKLLDNGHTII